MQINNLNRINNRRARFIVATADLSAERYHTTNAQLHLFICIIVSIWPGKLHHGYDQSVPARYSINKEEKPICASPSTCF